MKLLVALMLVGLVGSAVAEVFDVPIDFDVPIEFDYHNAIGIPEAARIKAAEEALESNGARIVGGNPVALGQYPYMAGLVTTLTNGAISMCGSTLVTNTRLVTAAHCWQSPGGSASQFTVVLGSNLLFSGGTRINTSNVQMHANFNMFTNANDICLITIPWINFSSTINNIALATSTTNLFSGVMAWAVGYGRTSNSIGVGLLNHVQVQVITNAVCTATYNSTVLASTLCVATTGGRGTCTGDSGGPLVADNMLIGIASFTHSDGCQSGHPAGFTRITSYVSWIQSRL